ncbi:MAG: hypothetical protein HYT08_02215 [Candidatus Levybacteria bacterium]|nr:hypothetical protein [Candidatus Levybacteria bacterium]
MIAETRIIKIHGVNGSKPQQEIIASPENEPGSKAIVVVVFASPQGDEDNILLWTVRERETKPMTEKVAGQISFIAETRKRGESPLYNLLGALAEFSGDDRILLNHLYVTQNSYREGVVSIRKGEIPVDLAFLYYDGPMNGEVKPLDGIEVEGNGWLTIEDIRSLHPGMVRNIVFQSININEIEGIIPAIINGSKFPLSQVLAPEFSISAYNFHREQTEDLSF